MTDGYSQTMASTNRIRPGVTVRLPDNSLAIVVARSIVRDAWHIDIQGTILRDWPADQLVIA